MQDGEAVWADCRGVFTYSYGFSGIGGGERREGVVQVVLSVQTTHRLAKFRVLGVWPDGGELLGEVLGDGGGFGANLGVAVRVGKGDGLVGGSASADSGYLSD